MNETFELTVPEQLDGVRADKALAAMLRDAGEERPRAEVQRALDAGLVRLGERVLGKKTPLRAGSVVSLRLPPPLLSEAVPDPEVVFEVVFEDEHLLVVNKPPGLVVHPARGHRSGTLVNGLLARGDFDAGADPLDPEGHLRPGIVHRLDKDTSGLMVVAKTPACREGLKRLFQAHDIERAYVAIAIGEVTAARFDTPHGRHPRSRLKFTSRLPEREGQRRAITIVEPLEALAGATYLRCRLETGRTHQIRVHLAERANAPILGDALYGGLPAPSAGELAVIARALGRQALHATILGFVHPITQAELRWEAPPPEDMEAARRALTRPST
ncbi:MAG: RluA family pseudouridine synthase [Polyangiaceae bacterium]